MRVSGPSFLPMIAAAFTGGSFIVATFHLYTWAVITGALAIATILYWLWRDTAPVPLRAERDIGLGVRVPTYVSGPRSCGWWGMFITMLADVTAYLTLVFSFYYYVAINPSADRTAWTMPLVWPLAGLVLSVAVAGAVLMLRRRGVSGAPGAGLLTLLALLAAAAAAALMVGPALAAIAPTSHALAAMIWILLGWSAVHVGLGVLMLLFCAVAAVTGRLDEKHDIHLWNVEAYWYFAAFMAALSVLVVLSLPVVP
jgi:heme/copper-type cytochrome/quinol oxidase subunit 3